MQSGKRRLRKLVSNTLLRMASSLKRDAVVILRMDGEDIIEFINSPGYEVGMVNIFLQIELLVGSLHKYFVEALENLTVEQGIPPISDPWVMSNIVEPALDLCTRNDHDKPVTHGMLLLKFKEFAENMARHLKAEPVIVAHSENNFDGTGIKRLLSNKFELEKTLNSAIEYVPKDWDGKMLKERLRVALDKVGPVAHLPPIDQMDNVIAEAVKMLNRDDGKPIKAEELKKILTEILERVMLQLEGNPITISTNSVVRENIYASSSAGA